MSSKSIGIQNPKLALKRTLTNFWIDNILEKIYSDFGSNVDMINDLGDLGGSTSGFKKI